MLKFVHHIQYVANSRDEFVDYMEKNFGLKPDELEDREAGSKHALYKIGETEIQVSEPAPGSGQAEYLAQHGPGVHHVAWAIDDATQVAQQLRAKGNTLRGEQGFTQSAHGYSAINIDPKDSMGIHFQLIEDRR
ncbi:MAG TPA: VOC family protein [Dehalococcoidia bacterium]|nr:VOC family protein [Dehalococcoidia bacterium]